MRRSIFILMPIVVLLCGACTDSGDIKTETSIQEEEIEASIQEEELDTSIQEETDEAFDDYQILNANLLGKEFSEWPGEELIQKGALAYAEEIKGEFVPAFDEGIHFPEELVAVLEKILFDSGHIDIWTDESFFYTPLKKWKDNVETLDAKDYKDYYPEVYGAFRFSTDGKKEYYVLKLLMEEPMVRVVFAWRNTEKMNY